MRTCIKIVNPDDIFCKETDSGKEFYYYKHICGSRKNYNYQVTFMYEHWKSRLDKIGISWEDIKNGKLKIRSYGRDSFLGLPSTKFIKL